MNGRANINTTMTQVADRFNQGKCKMLYKHNILIFVVLSTFAKQRPSHKKYLMGKRTQKLKFVWSDEFDFLMNNLNGRVHMHRYPGNALQKNNMSVETVFSLETLGPIIQVEGTFSCITDLNINEKQLHAMNATVFYDCKIMYPATARIA